MDLAIGLPVIAALVVAFVAVRRMLTRRRRSLEAYTRTRDERLRKSKPRDRRTSRAEMRANDDPTTMMGQMRSMPRKEKPYRR
jgi:hypothetical protein